MNRTVYDDQKLRAYLLAELSCADAVEAFDELSFTDENFAIALKSAENDLIDAYLQDNLDDITRGKFEAVYLSTAHRREKVEFARAVQTFAGKEIPVPKTKDESPAFFASWKIFENPRRVFQFGFATAALAILLFGIVWFAISRREKSGGEIVLQKTPTPEIAASVNQSAAPENGNSDNRSTAPVAENETNDVSRNTNQNLPDANRKNSNANETAEPPNQNSNRKKAPEKNETAPPLKPVIASFFLAPPLRGANKIPLFGVPKNASRINVELRLEASDYEFYHVTLTNETGDINLWRRGSLKAKNKGDAKVLNVIFPATLLRNGFYSLTVSGINQNGEAEIIANYPFRVNEK